MSIFCVIGGHVASRRTLWNEGWNFSRCARCAADLVESNGRWGPPPQGYRVVWKKRQSESLELRPPAPLDLPAEAYDAVLVEEQRSGNDRRAARSTRVLTSLRNIERRRSGDRRNGRPKKQALLRG